MRAKKTCSPRAQDSISRDLLLVSGFGPLLNYAMKRKVKAHDVVNHIQNYSWPAPWDRIKYQYDLPSIQDVLDHMDKTGTSFLNTNFQGGEDYLVPSFEKDGTYLLRFFYRDNEDKRESFSSEKDLNKRVLEYFYGSILREQSTFEPQKIPLTAEALENCKHDIVLADCVICSSEDWLKPGGKWQKK